MHGGPVVGAVGVVQRKAGASFAAGAVTRTLVSGSAFSPRGPSRPPFFGRGGASASGSHVSRRHSGSRARPPAAPPCATNIHPLGVPPTWRSSPVEINQARRRFAAAGV